MSKPDTTVAATIKEHLDALDAAEPGAAFEDIAAVRPLTPLTRQDCEEAMRILMTPPMRLPGTKAAKGKR